MALVVATICLTVVAVFFITVVAVLAFFMWNGALWAFDRHAETSQAAKASQDRPQNRVAQAALQQGAGQYAGLTPGANLLQGGSSWPGGFDLHVPRSIDLTSSPAPYSRSPLLSPVRGRGGRGASSSAGLPGSRQPRHVAEAEDADDAPDISVEMVSPQRAQPEDIRRGFASQLACKFSGEVAFHFANVSAVAASYSLEADDICYCFLCLEEASSVDGGASLALKPYGLNTYAARIWMVALARFVKRAQGQRWATDDGRVETLTEEWKYQLEGFVQAVKSCEGPFHRKHGQVLCQAFKQEAIRISEVARARRSLLTAGKLAAPRQSRLKAAALADAPQQAGASKRAAALGNGDGSTGPFAALDDKAAWPGTDDAESNSSAMRGKRLRDNVSDSDGATAPAAARKRIRSKRD